MNQTIKNPARHAKRSLERSTRRDRPSYPASSTEGVRIERKECGRNNGVFVYSKARLVLKEEFIFERGISRPSRSKYTPHIGVKESIRKDAMALVC